MSKNPGKLYLFHRLLKKIGETEYLDYKLSIKVVDDIHEAIDHINTYGSGHTDSIITDDKDNAALFMNLVDSRQCILELFNKVL